MNRELLEKPFSPDQIQQRKGLDGDVLDYVAGAAVIQRLRAREGSASIMRAELR